MIQYPEPLAKLIESYTKLPGIGQKTATRLAFYTLSMQEDDVTNFAKSLLSAKRTFITVVFVAILLKTTLVQFVAIRPVIIRKF